MQSFDALVQQVTDLNEQATALGALSPQFLNLVGQVLDFGGFPAPHPDPQVRAQVLRAVGNQAIALLDEYDEQNDLVSPLLNKALDLLHTAKPLLERPEEHPDVQRRQLSGLDILADAELKSGYVERAPLYNQARKFYESFAEGDSRDADLAQLSAEIKERLLYEIGPSFFNPRLLSSPSKTSRIEGYERVRQACDHVLAPFSRGVKVPVDFRGPYIARIMTHMGRILMFESSNLDVGVEQSLRLFKRSGELLDAVHQFSAARPDSAPSPVDLSEANLAYTCAFNVRGVCEVAVILAQHHPMYPYEFGGALMRAAIETLRFDGRWDEADALCLRAISELQIKLHDFSVAHAVLRHMRRSLQQGRTAIVRELVDQPWPFVDATSQEFINAFYTMKAEVSGGSR
jgi:hypothetical protein